jgi:hypothetical protein
MQAGMPFLAESGGRMLKEVRHKFSFGAVDDSGEHHQLHVFVDILDVASFRDPNAEIEGQTRIVTDKVEVVNRLEQGEYEVVVSGLRLRSDDPLAP